MYELKTEDVYGYFSSNKEMFHFSNYSTKSKYNEYKDVLQKTYKSYNQYKDASSNNKCIRPSMNIIQRP